RYMPEWPELDVLAERYPQHLCLVPLDVGSTESVQSAAAAVGQAAGRVDLLINNAGIGGGRSDLADESGEGGLDYDAIHRAYNVNALGAIRMVEAFMPLMEDSPLKRLCFVSSEAGSISLAHRTGGFGYCMSKAALNMAVKITFNRLRPRGYTFRLYHPGWMRSYMSGQKGTAGDMEPEESAASAIPYFVEGRDDEDRLVLIDYLGQEWPF
ncbi:MAG TPA: SDR family NAD(P)-dependent oxidoreductase, partial [Chloroflexi bacterium]|nr:SDR family NAD(P)-dependent oxidoreductase [Chloroflexota bacterium]